MKLVDVREARNLLLQGEVVAIPTETVYGLGGWIHSEEGLRKIFSTKERPFFDPLIVHVDGVESAKKLTAHWTAAHEVLAQAHWPGPLTLIAPKGPEVNPLITAGLDSVGLRCPKHERTLELLRSLKGGVAAPSANKFGKTSPTSASHVDQEFGDTVSIIEGGSSEVGIESTVVGIKEENGKFLIEIYRPGYFTKSMLGETLKKAGLDAQVSYAQSPVAPGQLKHHYMPKIPLVIVPEGFNWELERKKIEEELGVTFSRPVLWIQPQSAALASRELYQKMREFDERGHDLILVPRPATHDSEEWLGIWNRLDKAKTLAL